MQIGTSGHTVIIGAGVIGAAIGQSLVSRGQSVTVIERGLIAAKPGASGASAALLEPLAGAHPELRDTAQRALARLPGLCRDLLADTGIDPQWSRPGSMVLVSRERDATWLRTFRMPMFHEIGEPVEWLTGHQARVLEPAIGSHVVGALRIPSTQSVHAPGYVRALVADVTRRGGVVLAETVVTGFRRDGLTVRAVVTSAGEILCDRVVIACARGRDRWPRSLAMTFRPCRSLHSEARSSRSPRLAVRPVSPMSSTVPEDMRCPSRMGPSLSGQPMTMSALTRHSRLRASVSSGPSRMTWSRASLMNQFVMCGPGSVRSGKAPVPHPSDRCRALTMSSSLPGTAQLA